MAIDIQTGTFINRNGARFNVNVLSCAKNTNHYPGGGNPFTVTSFDVEIEFDRRINATGCTKRRLLGFLSKDDIVFLTDGVVDSRLILNQTI